MTILGINDASLLSLITILAAVKFILIPLMIICGFTHDIQRQDDLIENTE